MVPDRFVHTPPQHRTWLLSGYTHVADVGPCWLADDLDATPMERYTVPVWGKVLSLPPLPHRYCIGTYDAPLGQYVPCPHRRPVRAPRQHCYGCFEVMAFNPAFYHVPVSQLSPRQQERNRKPHGVYLAYFGPGLVKVGIAYHTRVLKRWLEQGARAATLLHEAHDAYAARALEEKIHTRFHLPERVTVAQKKKLLGSPYSHEAAVQALTKHCQAIAKEVSLADPLPAIHDLQHHYFPTTPPSYLTDADCTQVPLSGRIVGMVGSIVVYSQSGRHWMRALRPHIGSTQVSATEMPLVATQGTLFG